MVDGVKGSEHRGLQRARGIQVAIVDPDQVDPSQALPNRRQGIRPQVANRPKGLGAQERGRKATSAGLGEIRPDRG